MLREIEIENFKSIKKIRLDNLSRINLFGGKNNAGKTSILEALFLFYDRLNPNMLNRQYGWRGISELPLKEEFLFAPIFNSYDLNKTIKITIKNSGVSPENLTIKFKDDLSKRVALINSNDKNFDDNVISSSSLLLELTNSINAKQTFELSIKENGLELNVSNGKKADKNIRFLSARQNMHPNENAILFGELDISGQASDIVEFLKILEPRLKSVTSITLSNNSSLLYGDIGIGKKVPINYMGDGIGRILTILISIVSNKNGILVIDEIENGIHYSMLPKVWEMISEVANKYDCQIFATTHSYECLISAVNGIKENQRNEFKYYRVENTKENNQVSKSFTYDSLEVALSNGWEVR